MPGGRKSKNKKGDSPKTPKGEDSNSTVSHSHSSMKREKSISPASFSRMFKSRSKRKNRKEDQDKDTTSSLTSLSSSNFNSKVNVGMHIQNKSIDNSLSSQTEQPSVEIDVLGYDNNRSLNNMGASTSNSHAHSRFIDILGNTTTNGTKFIDVIGKSSTEQTINNANANTNMNNMKNASFGGTTDMLVGLGSDDTLEESATGLNISAQKHSPIKFTERQFEKSFINVIGDESLRGAGTPPGSSVGPPVYNYNEKSIFLQNASVAAIKREKEEYSKESQPLISNDTDATNYSSFDPWNKNTKNNYNMMQFGDSPTNRSENRGRSKSQSLSNGKRWKTSFKVWFLIIVSLIANVVLFSAKIVIFVESRSLAVLASAVDSLLDLISQAIVYLALRGSQEADEQIWPVGRSRLEPVGIIICASLMGMTSLQIVYQSGLSLLDGILSEADRRVPYISELTVYLLTSAIAIKAFLFMLCYSLKDRSHSVMVLAEDHRNDVLSNSVALVTAYLSHRLPQCWWLDAAGAIVISLYICIIWTIVAKEQAEFLVGRAAQPEFLAEVRQMANEHHHNMFVDIVRAYHFGKRYLVELEVVLPEQMYVSEAHDIALELQKEVEKLHQVERAFVHVDYMTRDENEHKDARIDLNTPPAEPGEPADDIEDLLIGENVEVTGTIYQNRHPQA
eukprot:CAMPEP_0204832586 /NCGR_PEP_ID=MMETSP1346-20131115/14227_1 /ASSEMBLY_ACC=CAM_ASM_000771 /TAXON_ID=215587 /ORGANISM="Aplanochytrium stocchinoi, Strain GSBS06" /LENGTH=675 /DNA_ID=CAMNT_0051964505 /DNA_START=121 /DNA_END=2148 /DNA_ORIENTATION=-